MSQLRNFENEVMTKMLKTTPKEIVLLIQKEGTILNVEKGMRIFQEGERCNSLFLIKSGNVQIGKKAPSGKELTIRICGTNSIIGENLVFAPYPFHTTTAQALVDSELLAIHPNILEKHFINNYSMLTAYLNWLQTENLKNQSRLRDLVLYGKQGALYSTLIRLSNTYGEFCSLNEINIMLALTPIDLANLCATSPDLIKIMLKELCEKKIIKIEENYITVLNMDYLKHNIECSNCPLEICRID